MTIHKMTSRVNQDITLGLAGDAMIALGWILVFAGMMFGVIIEIAGIIALLGYSLMTGHMAKQHDYKAWKKYTGSHRVVISEGFCVFYLIAVLVVLFII